MQLSIERRRGWRKEGTEEMEGGSVEMEGGSEWHQLMRQLIAVSLLCDRFLE